MLMILIIDIISLNDARRPHDTAEKQHIVDEYVCLSGEVALRTIEPIFFCSSNACIIVNVSIFDNSESISLSWSVLSVFTINRDIVTSLMLTLVR